MFVLGAKKKISEHGTFHGIKSKPDFKSLADKGFSLPLMTEWE
jgi:hypothetical protein